MDTLNHITGQPATSNQQPATSNQPTTTSKTNRNEALFEVYNYYVVESKKRAAAAPDFH